MGKEWIYRLITWLSGGVTRLLFGLKIHGRANIPAGHGFLLIARHRSYWDIPLLAVALKPERRIHFVARRTLQRNLLLRPLIKNLTIAIDREHFRLQDYRRISQALEADKIVGIFPEGTMKKAEAIGSGVVRFAERSGRPILPVRIAARGPYPPHYPFGLPRIDIWIGRSFRLAELESELNRTLSRQERYARLGQALMQRIERAGLPAERPLRAGQELR